MTCDRIARAAVSVIPLPYPIAGTRITILRLSSRIMWAILNKPPTRATRLLVKAGVLRFCFCISDARSIRECAGIEARGPKISISSSHSLEFSADIEALLLGCC